MPAGPLFPRAHDGGGRRTQRGTLRAGDRARSRVRARMDGPVASRLHAGRLWLGAGRRRVRTSARRRATCPRARPGSRRGSCVPGHGPRRLRLGLEGCRRRIPACIRARSRQRGRPPLAVEHGRSPRPSRRGDRAPAEGGGARPVEHRRAALSRLALRHVRTARGRRHGAPRRARPQPEGRARPLLSLRHEAVAGSRRGGARRSRSWSCCPISGCWRRPWLSTRSDTPPNRTPRWRS